MEIIGLGMATLDILIRLRQMPTWQGCGSFSAFEMDGGGMAATACVAAAKLGAQVGFIGTTGDDENAERKLASFRAAGVDLSRMAIRPMAEDQLVLVYVHEETGERTFCGMRHPADSALQVAELDRDYIQAAKYLHLDGYHPEAAIQAAGWAHQAGMQVSLDGSKTDGGPLSVQTIEIVRQTDILICASGFAQSLTGLADPQSARRAASILARASSSKPRASRAATPSRGTAISTRPLLMSRCSIRPALAMSSMARIWWACCAVGMRDDAQSLPARCRRSNAARSAGGAASPLTNKPRHFYAAADILLTIRINMTLVSIADQLKKAQAEGYAVPMFDIFDLQGAEGMFAAVEEKPRSRDHRCVCRARWRSPMPMPLARYLRQRAIDADVPVSLMLDHGASFEQCIQAISYGFSDVMFDGSRLPLEENIAHTQMVVRAAKSVGLAVEAELGHVGSGSDYPDVAAKRLGFTEPEMAVRFVEETGIDFLAVAIGNAHGVYRGEPHIDLDLLAEIRARVDVPLVLHGGSGISEEQFRAAVKAGIAKINIATDLYVTAARRLGRAMAEREITYFDMIPMVAEVFHERCCYFLDLFGTSGRA